MSKDKNSIEASFSRDMETRLMLPTSLTEALEVERTIRVEDTNTATPESAHPVTSRKKTQRDRDADEIMQLSVSDPTAGKKNRFRLVDLNAAKELAVEAINGQVESDARARIISLIKRLCELGEYRELNTVPADWHKRLAKLDARFPNMREALDYLRAMLSLSIARDGTISFEPCLLNGPPGVGKTFICRSMSEVLGTGFCLIHMETQQEGSALAGSSQYWANTRPGTLFEKLVYGRFGNFICMVDEVDKAQVHHHDPLAGLYSLLERGTAKEFADMSFPWLRLDASRVLWVLTSNESENIPAPILSRLRMFSIPAPTPGEMRQIIRTVYAQICKEQVARRRMSPLSELIVDQFSGLPPRRLRSAIFEAIGRALCAKRRDLLPEDITEVGVVRRSIGFMPN